MQTGHDQPFLTIVTWPESWTARDAAPHVADACGLDVPTVRLRLAKPPPIIVGLIAPARTRDAVKTLARLGCDAFTNTLEDLEALGPSTKIRDLRLADGVLELDLWRGPSQVIARDDVEVLVRATLKRKEKEKKRPPRHRSRPMRSPGLHTPYSLGLAMEFQRPPPPKITTSDKLDIHTRDGRVFQIDGDKFGYGILGDLRGHGDKANMDSMCELLAHVSPNEVVDEYFALWRPPPGFERLRVPEMKLNGDDPAFAFYSRWAALLYRHVGGEPPAPA